MAGRIVNGAIPNLINGVSQQAAAIRLASQAEVQENAYSSVVEGLRKRPPTEHVSVLSAVPFGNAYLHTINRDTAERYLVVARQGSIRVFDTAGAEKAVNAPGGWGYLATSNPAEDIGMVTVADYTFVVNKTKPVAATTEKSPARPFEALIWVKQGAYASSYTVTVNGTTTVSHTTPAAYEAGFEIQIQTTYIASQLVTKLQTALGSGFTVERFGSIIRLVRATDYSIKVADAQSGNSLKLIKNTIQRFSELPETVNDGFVAKVVGDNTSKFDAYYVRFEDNAGTTSGTWVETVKPGLFTTLDAATMPHVLVREANGSFTFKPAEWGKNEVGDEDSSPWPSFVGRPIADVFFHRNRLGFITDENVIFSRAGDFFNFFRQTVTQLVDTDPIDVAVSHTKVSILRHAVPFDKELFLFSDQTQFVLNGPDVLTPKSVAINVTTEFECSRHVRPVGSGKAVLFAAPRGANSTIREYYLEADTATYDAVDVTGHVPKYLPSGIFKMAVNTAENVLLCLSHQEPDAVFVYQWFWSDGAKVQSAWHKWKFRAGTRVLNADFIESTVFLVVQDEDGRVRLERMSIEPSHTDDGASFTYHLDARLPTQGLASSYSSAANRTTFTLPYATHDGLSFVVSGSDGALVPGVERPLRVDGPTLVSVEGDARSVPALIGARYTMRYQLSPLYMRAEAPGGGISAVVTGRLQLRSLTFTYERTGYCRVSVTPSGDRNTYAYVCTGRTLGTFVAGSIAIGAGAFRVPLMARNTEVKVVIENDSFLPCHVLSAEWTGFYVNQGTRL